LGYVAASAQSYSAEQEGVLDNLGIPIVGGLSWGLSAGINYSNFNGADKDFIFATAGTAYKPGIFISTYVHSRLAKHWSLKHELGYSYRQIEVHALDQQENLYATKLRMHYMDLNPASIHWSLRNWSIYAGPSLGMLLDAHTLVQDVAIASVAYKDHGIFGDPANDESQSRYLQKIDFALHSGLEYHMYAGLSMGLRHRQGLVDIFQYANTFTNEDTKVERIRVYNSSWDLYLAFTF